MFWVRQSHPKKSSECRNRCNLRFLRLYKRILSMSSRKHFKKGMVPVWPDGLWAYGFVVPTINPTNPGSPSENGDGT